MNRPRLIAVAALALLSADLEARQGLAESQKLLTIGSGLAGSNFGAAVAADGSLFAVGRPGTSPDIGRVYLYSRSALGELEHAATLFPEAGFPYGTFGRTVAVDGYSVAVGSASGLNSGAGSVHMFARSGEEYVVDGRFSIGSVVPGESAFGYAVAADGGRVAVSDPVPAGSGRIRIFSGGWALTATLPQPSGVTGHFGLSLALDGDLLAVGTGGPGAAGGGSVQLFRLVGTTWVLEQSLEPTTAPYGQFAGDEFGTSVALARGAGAGDATLLVGAPGDQVPGDASTAGRGAAFVFRRQGGAWTQTARLTPPVPVAGARFGASVALRGDAEAYCGADGEGAQAPPDPSRGAVFSFARTGGAWAFQHRLSAAGGALGDNFGAALAAADNGSETALLVGAPNALGSATGAVHLFDVSPAAAVEEVRALEPFLTDMRFGASVALDGDSAVVGAPAQSVSGIAYSGVATVYTRRGGVWEHSDTLWPAGLTNYDQFGTSVAISGDLIAIGIPFDDRAAGTDVGSVILYERINGNWLQSSTLLASDGADGDRFGLQVHIRSGTVAVGAPFDANAAGADAGAVYLFRRNGTGWAQSAKLAPTDLAAGDRFGSSLALISSSRVLVGSPGDDVAGAAYVFDGVSIINGVVWTQRTKFLPSDGASGDSFGAAVAALGRRFVVGAPGHDSAQGADAGAAYFFEASGPPGTPGNTFTQVRKFVAPGGSAGDAFGAAVAVDAATIFVGSPMDDRALGSDVGAVHAFRPATGSTWSAFTAVALDGAARAEYGRSLAIGSGTLLVGAPVDSNVKGLRAGAVHVVDPWFGGAVGDNYCAATANSTGQAARIAGAGSPVRASNDLVLSATQLPPNTTSFFLVSRAAGLVAQPGGSSGVLCLGGGIGRFVGPGQVSNSGVGGAVSLPVDLAALPQPNGAVSGVVGETWHFQAWFRDSSAGGTTSNFTDGLAVVLH